MTGNVIVIIVVNFLSFVCVQMLTSQAVYLTLLLCGCALVQSTTISGKQSVRYHLRIITVLYMQ